MNQRSDCAIRTSLWRLQLNANTVNDGFMQGAVGLREPIRHD